MSKIKKVLIVGSSGYIGTHLKDFLIRKCSYDVVCCQRDGKTSPPGICSQVVYIPDILSFDDWPKVLESVDCVVYLAGVAHTKASHVKKDLYIRINCNAAVHIAQVAQLNNVKRFIYISTIGVLGDKTEPGEFFTNSSEYNPKSVYAASKMMAEQRLEKISRKSNMKIIILRPPLVFGPNAPGNFKRIVCLTLRRMPLPLKSFKHKKNMISVNNLSSIIERCFNASLPVFSKFVVSDDSEFSAFEIGQYVSETLNEKVLFFNVPLPLLKFVVKLVGRGDDIDKLSSELMIDSSDTRAKINWKPIEAPKDALIDAINSYRS